MSGSRALQVALLSLVAWASAGHVVPAQNVINLEYEKKAKYLLYFAVGYVAWPNQPFAGSDKQFVICLLGQDRFGQDLRKYEGKPLPDGKRIVVQRCATMADYRPCHILYISAQAAEGHRGETPEQRLAKALDVVAGRPVLVVGESPGLAQRGAIINFRPDPASGLLKMEINRAAQQGAELTIRSDVLNLNIVDLVKQGGG